MKSFVFSFKFGKFEVLAIFKITFTFNLINVFVTLREQQEDELNLVKFHYFFSLR